MPSARRSWLPAQALQGAGIIKPEVDVAATVEPAAAELRHGDRSPPMSTALDGAQVAAPGGERPPMAARGWALHPVLLGLLLPL